MGCARDNGTNKPMPSTASAVSSGDCTWASTGCATGMNTTSSATPIRDPRVEAVIAAPVANPASPRRAIA